MYCIKKIYNLSKILKTRIRFRVVAQFELCRYSKLSALAISIITDFLILAKKVITDSLRNVLSFCLMCYFVLDPSISAIFDFWPMMPA